MADISSREVERIARVCHTVNASLCESFGDHSQRPWAEAEDWQRESAISGVRFAIDNPDAPDEARALAVDLLRWAGHAEREEKR